MISTYTGPDGQRHSHDYTQEIQSKFDYVESHDPFRGGGGGGGQTQNQTPNQNQPEPQVTAGVPSADLQQGDRGSEVQKLQEALVQLGYLTQADINTGPGIFGPKTEAAVKRFQAEHHVPTTGYFGPQTRRALAQALRGH
jgi:peptidoglycan hydrolase-like protein with peptidoglycan-binding domain